MKVEEHKKWFVVCGTFYSVTRRLLEGIESQTKNWTKSFAILEILSSKEKKEKENKESNFF